MIDKQKFLQYTVDFKRSINKNKFIMKANEKYHSAYDYSKINYVNAHKPITIFCKKHNIEFITTPAHHLKHSGCQYCFKDIVTYGKKNFITEAKKLHDDYYDYSLVDYKSNNERVIIVCPKHGVFRQKPSHHLKGQRCYKCFLDSYRKHENNNITTNVNLINQNLEKLKQKFPDYDFEDYIHFDKPIKVICKKHGVIYKTPHSLLRPDGVACKLCNRNSSKYRDAYIAKAKEKHGDKFDYSKLDMNDKKPIFICKKHGEFRQEKSNHLTYDLCCPKCISENLSVSKDEFLKRAYEKFGNYYNYSKMNYVDINTPIDILCTKHGYFKKIPSEHLRTHRKGIMKLYGGCPVCFNRSNYEIKVCEQLNNLGINYVTQFKLDNYDFRWDICIPQIKLLIEVDDDSHLTDERKEIDKIKSIIANSFNYKLIRLRVITVLEKKNLMYNLIKSLKSIIKYKTKDKLFTSFLEFAKYMKLPPEAKPEDYQNYEFKRIIKKNKCPSIK